MSEQNASPSSVSFSVVGQDSTVKRQSYISTKRSPLRGPPGGLARAGSNGFLQAQKSRSRKTYLGIVVCSFLALSSIYLVKVLHRDSIEHDGRKELIEDSFSTELETGAPLVGGIAEQSSGGTTERDFVGESRKKSKKDKKRRRKKRDKHKRDGDEDEPNSKHRDRTRDRDRRRPARPPPAPPPPPENPLEPRLPPNHACANFTLPPPPSDPKRSGPRACPVCYLPTEEAVGLKPKRHRADAEPVLKALTFVTEKDEGEARAIGEGKRPRFAGHQSLQERADSFEIKDNMHVHCGFVWGGEPGSRTGFDSSPEDREYMRSCDNIVVASAIFGAYDLVQQPSDISDIARETVCFVMFVDELTYSSLLQDGTLKDDGKLHVGLWRLVVVANLPYTDPRRTGKIPKLLAHRLFPNAQFSVWVDAKLELRADPYKILERFLWRGNFTWAISRHYARFDVYVEAERNKAAGKYKNASIDEQMDVYRREGMTPYSESKLPIISDVPEGCVIVRELNPLTNLLACIWFNEVDRFTSRDQLSFGFCRDKIRAGVPGWNVNMFLDCERRNFVDQKYHKFVLKEKFGNVSISSGRGKLEQNQQQN